MKARVLLVEDNEANRYLATFVLERAGYDVLHASNGREAVRLALAERPHLVLMDLEMPEMDGYEATTLIRAAAEGRDIPVVAVTSLAHAGDRAKARAIGFSDYIEKPYDPEDFVRRLQRVLSRPSSA
jgi:two-component system, cell cycle response regulator DivK